MSGQQHKSLETVRDIERSAFPAHRDSFPPKSNVSASFTKSVLPITKSSEPNDVEIIKEPFSPQWEINSYFSKECQEHFDYLSLIIENLLDIVIVTDCQGFMRFISASAQSILGYDVNANLN